MLKINGFFHAMRALVAMSGGVDSSVAALLLKRAGWSVEGVFMQNWDARIESGSFCTVEKDYHDAERVAKILKMPLRRVHFVREYWHNVFSPVLSEYSNGRTPNPDLLCNREIKFGKLFKWAQDNGYPTIATGHYARIHKADGEANFLAQAADLPKDQSYFLAAIPDTSLANVIFPVGSYKKVEIKEIARRNDLGFLLDKPESMGVCFVGKRPRFADFLGEFIPSTPGEIVEFESSRVIGQHKGVELYTIGQNLKIGGMPAKMYLVSRDMKNGILFVSRKRYNFIKTPEF